MARKEYIQVNENPVQIKKMDGITRKDWNGVVHNVCIVYKDNDGWML